MLSDVPVPETTHINRIANEQSLPQKKSHKRHSPQKHHMREVAKESHLSRSAD